MATDRATIEQLKRENATLQGLLVQKGRAAAGDDGAGSGRAWLEGQIRLHKTKADQEEQLARQIQAELENIQQQLKQKSATEPDTPASKSAAGVSGSSKQLIILQERLTHQKQRLDSINACNLDKQKARQDVVKRTQATQAAAQQLHKQLSITQAETESILQLTSVMEAAQQKASHLAELLQSQDDAEHLAFSAVAQQAVELQLAAEQQQRAQLHAAAEQAAASRAAAEACEGSCTKEDAQAVLQQLQEMVDAAGVSLCSGSSSGRDSQCPDGAAPELGGACRTYADLVQRLSQLQADSYRMFVQCSIADWQQQQQVDEHQT